MFSELCQYAADVKTRQSAGVRDSLPQCHHFNLSSPPSALWQKCKILSWPQDGIQNCYQTRKPPDNRFYNLSFIPDNHFALNLFCELRLVFLF